MLYGMTTSPIFGLRREIDRLFDDTFTRDGFNWTPAVDIKENDSEIRLDLELPGLKPEDVELTAENGVLTVRGEKKTERKEGEENRYHVVERTYGSFFRTFQLTRSKSRLSSRTAFCQSTFPRRRCHSRSVFRSVAQCSRNSKPRWEAGMFRISK